VDPAKRECPVEATALLGNGQLEFRAELLVHRSRHKAVRFEKRVRLDRAF
jgi:hypothetical protein